MSTPQRRCAVLALALAAACESDAGKVERVFETAVQRDLAVTVEANGVVKPLTELRVKSKASGKVIEIAVPTGSPVKSGDVLIRLDPIEEQQRLDQARSNRLAAEAQRDRAQVQLADLERQLRDSARLLSQKLTSPEAHELLKTQAGMARAGLKAAEAGLAQADALLREAQLRYEDTTIRAPMDGVLLDRFVEIGAIIASGITTLTGGTDVALVGDMSRLRVVTKVDEVDIGLVKEGQRVEVVLDAFPNRTFQGQVSSLASRGLIEGGVTTFGCEVMLEGEGLADVKPEMTASVRIEVARLEKALTLPLVALVYGSDGWKVKIEKPGDAEALDDKAVKVGLDDGQHVQIVEGLAEGDRVVVFSQSERERQAKIAERKSRFFGK